MELIITSQPLASLITSHTKAGATVDPAFDADCCCRTVASAFKSAFIPCVCAKEILIGPDVLTREVSVSRPSA